jgi:hypothetical protein
MKVIIYTANIGDYDNDISHNVIDYPFYKINCKGVSNSRLYAREIKLNPHKFLPDHDYSIWIDSNLQMINPKFDFGYDIVTWKHPIRNCVYEEANECIRLKKDNSETIFKQIQKYRIENYPESNGMINSSFLIRKNTPKMQEFCEAWWNELKNNSIRDQLSFNYIFNKFNLSILLLNSYEGFRKLPHKHHK